MSDLLTAEQQLERIVDAPVAHEPTKGQELHRLANLTWTLAVTDWRLKFYGSALGVAWSLIRPFAFFGVIYIVFTEIAGLDKSVHNYGVYILFALVLFSYFAEVTTQSVQSLVTRESLLRKMAFEPIVIPMSVMVTGLLNLGTTLAAVTLFALANGVYPDFSWLQMIPIVIALSMLASGIGMLLSAWYVRYRDVYPIWEVMSQTLFYASSTLYVADPTVPEEWRREFLFNPISALFAQMRHAVIDPTAPSLATLMGGFDMVVIPMGIIVVIFCFGAWVFRRASPRIAENL